MSGGLTLIPTYTEDNDFPAYQDRLLIKSLGVQAGVVEAEDFKVTAGSGLQVNVNKGKSFVEQTGAIEESSNSFYNGFYNILNPTMQNPYNSVAVSSVNPTIAQIIVRIYDVEQLKTTGSSFARIEWLNGTANAGATKAHIEEGKALEFGAAALPQSSLRLCYVIVPKNATTSSEYTIMDERPYVNNNLITNIRSTSGMAKPGELFLSGVSVTATLPKPVINNEIGFFNIGSSGIITIKTQSGNIIDGDFTESSEVNLLAKQHLTLKAINELTWTIVNGEPNREQVYSGYRSITKEAAEAGILSSATRMAFVHVQTAVVTTGAQIEVAGKQAAYVNKEAGSTAGFFVMPGQKWTTTLNLDATTLLF